MKETKEKDSSEIHPKENSHTNLVKGQLRDRGPGKFEYNFCVTHRWTHVAKDS